MRQRMTTGRRRPSFDYSRRLAAFEAARRHTRRVLFLRKALPVAGTVVLAGLMVAARLTATEGFDLAVARTALAKGAIVMDNPRVTGFDKSEREYRIFADRAVQKLSRPQEVRLEAIQAEVKAGGRGTATLQAAVGDYDNSKGRLMLSGGITLVSGDGYAVQCEEAEVDLKSGALVSDKPVTVSYGDSQTTGARLTMSDGGKLIVLENGVSTRLMPPKREPVATSALPTRRSTPRS